MLCYFIAFVLVWLQWSLQFDGNFVALDSAGAIIWYMDTNGTSSNTPSYAQMQDNGQFCVYRAATAEQIKCIGIAGNKFTPCALLT
jgi:hypothetical protein